MVNEPLLEMSTLPPASMALTMTTNEAFAPIGGTNCAGIVPAGNPMGVPAETLTEAMEGEAMDMVTMLFTREKVYVMTGAVVLK